MPVNGIFNGKVFKLSRIILDNMLRNVLKKIMGLNTRRSDKKQNVNMPKLQQKE